MANVVTLFDPADASKGKLIPIRGLVEGDEIDARMIADRLTTIKVAEAGSAIISGKNVKVYGDDGHGQLILLAELTSFNDDKYSVSLPAGMVYITGSVEYFESYAQIEEFDSSKNPALRRFISAGEHMLKKINLKGCAALEELQAGQENITSIDISDCVNLKLLSLNENPISSIDISKNMLIEWIDISYSQMSEIDMRNHPSLKSLALSGTNITNLDLSGTTSLLSLSAEELNLDVLYLREQKALGELHAYNSVINVLNASGLKELSYIDLGGAQIKKIDFSGCENLDGEITATNDVEYINISGTKLSYIEFDGNATGMHTFIARDILEEIEIIISGDEDSVDLTKFDVTGSNVVRIFALGVGLTEIIGLKTLRNVDDIQVNNNKISQIDFSGNENVSSISLSNNPICGLHDALFAAVETLPDTGGTLYINAYAATTELQEAVEAKNWTLQIIN